MRGSGRLTRKQLKGLLQSMQHESMIQESDISAILRRMDADGDYELSFSDFFASLLPYFIYGDLKAEPATNDVERRATNKRLKSENRSLLNI